MADPKLIAALSSILGPLPDVTEEKTETHATFLIKKKVFAFTRSSGPGVALKLPKERIDALRPKRYHPSVHGQTTLKEWIVYLSSVANRTNEVMKVLTVLGTIAIPALAISGIYGMNLKGLPFEESPHGAAFVAVLTILCTALLLYLLRKRQWF